MVLSCSTSRSEMCRIGKNQRQVPGQDSSKLGCETFCFSYSVCVHIHYLK